MKKINFILKKNEEYIINKQNLNIIDSNDKISFIIDNNKYIYYNNVLSKETKEELITLNFNEKKATILLKNLNKKIILHMEKVKIEKQKNIIKVEYIIETENNINNIIIIEYKKSS